MNDRFKFNAIVSSYYDIDTPENYEEFEPQFYLKNVDVFCTGEIGIDYDVLFEVVKEQSKNLTEKEIGQIMKHFEDNSNSPECDYVTIKPDKILQCTGLKDKNDKLIYEGDIVEINDELFRVIYWRAEFTAESLNSDVKQTERQHFNWYNFCYPNNQSIIPEVIGNIYETPELYKGE